VIPQSIDELLAVPPFSFDPEARGQLFLRALNDLTALHRQRCPEYARASNLLFPGLHIARKMDEVPYLPVGIFKSHALRSIDEKSVFKTLTSSGTTSSRVSRIVVDRETAARQTRALAIFIGSVLGPRRLPMIIVDSPNVVADRRNFSARGAGVLGMMNFGRDHFQALDDRMELNREGLRRFLDLHAGEPILLFGFTFMVWRYFLEVLQPKEVDLRTGILIHGGGWKKLAGESINRAEFHRAFRDRTELTRIYDYYGMVEQVGSIYLECEQGFFHVPAFSDIVVRDPLTWKAAPPGQQGVLQVLSALPTSYPGHSLLTEDLGAIVADDGCVCGRRGRHFVVHGRVPTAEPRGCSDTFVAPKTEAA